MSVTQSLETDCVSMMISELTVWLVLVTDPWNQWTVIWNLER